jgi:hypothetical protein
MVGQHPPLNQLFVVAAAKKTNPPKRIRFWLTMPEPDSFNFKRLEVAFLICQIETRAIFRFG